MNSNSLKQTVMSTVETQKFDDLENIKFDKIITSCLLYKRIITLSKNDISYENTYKDVAITGIVVNSLPFAVMIAAFAAVLGVLAVMKSRRSCR